MNETQTANGLGWFSLGLGATQVVAPRWLGRTIGVGDHPALMRTFGMREIIHGVGVLAPDRKAPGVWARVAGDALDLAVLALAIRQSRRRSRVAAAIGMVAAVALADFLTARRLQQTAA